MVKPRDLAPRLTLGWTSLSLPFGFGKNPPQGMIRPGANKVQPINEAGETDLSAGRAWVPQYQPARTRPLVSIRRNARQASLPLSDSRIASATCMAPNLVCTSSDPCSLSITMSSSAARRRDRGRTVAWSADRVHTARPRAESPAVAGSQGESGCSTRDIDPAGYACLRRGTMDQLGLFDILCLEVIDLERFADRGPHLSRLRRRNRRLYRRLKPLARLFNRIMSSNCRRDRLGACHDFAFRQNQRGEPGGKHQREHDGERGCQFRIFPGAPETAAQSRPR